ncbi:hypothetical protein OF83DRAFT_1090271 [Amylostereum chailletii]|nr:hypothetical protein OF83DRAFT_1090271 [Amylostereum chailletii]
MSDFQLVDIQGWEYDLHSIYTAYIGYFQQHNIPWYDRSWGHLFGSFEDFLSFSWPVVTLTDVRTGRAHIVTRVTSIGAFVKMVKTRFGDTLPLADLHILKVTPFESQQRHLRTISDYAGYHKLHGTLPAVVLGALKTRVRGGDPKTLFDLWNRREKTFLAIDFECSERNAATVLEWGYAAVRCGHLETVGSWPPIPEDNYRKGHYIVSETVDKLQNRHNPTYPWQYAFGESQVVARSRLPQIVQAIIGSLASPDSETISNSLVLVTHSINEDFRRLEEMKIKIPHNVLVIDIVASENSLFRAGLRGAMLDAKTGQPRQPNSSLSLRSLVHSLSMNIEYPLHNSGNDAFVCLLALQLLLDPKNTKIPSPRPRVGRAAASGFTRSISMFSPTPMVPPPILMAPIMPATIASRPHSTSPHLSFNAQTQPYGYSFRESSHPSFKDASTRRNGSVAVDEEGRITRPLSSGDMLVHEMTRATIG